MGFNCLKATATWRRQFTLHKFSKVLIVSVIVDEIWLVSVIVDGKYKYFKNVCSAITYCNSSVYWVLYWWFSLHFKINEKISLVKQIFWSYMHLSISLYNRWYRFNFLFRWILNILLKQVCQRYDFVFHENVTSRAWACFFRSDFIKWLVFIEICF